MKYEGATERELDECVCQVHVIYAVTDKATQEMIKLEYCAWYLTKHRIYTF